jgi:hypothetical protein
MAAVSRLSLIGPFCWCHTILLLIIPPPVLHPRDQFCRQNSPARTGCIFPHTAHRRLSSCTQSRNSRRYRLPAGGGGRHPESLSSGPGQNEPRGDGSSSFAVCRPKQHAVPTACANDRKFQGASCKTRAARHSSARNCAVLRPSVSPVTSTTAL